MPRVILKLFWPFRISTKSPHVTVICGHWRLFFPAASAGLEQDGVSMTLVGPFVPSFCKFARFGATISGFDGAVTVEFGTATKPRAVSSSGAATEPRATVGFVSAVRLSAWKPQSLFLAVSVKLSAWTIASRFSLSVNHFLGKNFLLAHAVHAQINAFSLSCQKFSFLPFSSSNQRHF